MPKSTPAVVVDAGTDASTSAPVLDAGPPPLPTGPAFTLHSRFPRSDASQSIYPLKDGIALLEAYAQDWKITTLRAGEKPVVVIPTRTWTTTADDMFRG